MEEFDKKFNERILKLKELSKKGSDYIFTICLLSMFNSFINIFSQNFNFAIGLGITQLIDGFIKVKVGEAIQVDKFGWISLNLLINFLLVGILGTFGYFVKKQSSTIFFFIIVFYIIDGFIFLFALDYISVGIHLVFMIFMIRSLIAMIKLNKEIQPL